MTDEEWQRLVFNRIFLGANSILLLCAFIMLALACILDPNPIHKLDSKGGFYAFNAVVFIFLSLLGLYGMRPLRKKLLLIYATSIAFLLVFRLLTGLVMLLALENNQSELIFLLSAGLIEMMLAILALGNAMSDQTEFNKLPPSSTAIDGSLPTQVTCKDDAKAVNGKNKLDNKSTDEGYNAFSKNSTLRRSMNANHAPRPPIQPNQSLVSGIQTTAGELIYVSPDNLVFNERSVDAPTSTVPRKLEQRGFNYAANLTQYSTIGKLSTDKKDPKAPVVTRNIPIKVNNDEVVTKTTLVAKPFQLNKNLLSKTAKPTGTTRNESSSSSKPSINFSAISQSSVKQPRKIDASTPDKKVENGIAIQVTPSNHKRQQSSSFLTNPILPYRTSTPSNLPPSIQAIGGGSSYSPQNTTSSIGTASKASIFDYNYSPINLNQISHHILNSQKPAGTPTTATKLEPSESADSNRLNRLPTTLSALRQNILMHKMNFLNNNSYNAEQYKQNIINQVVNETDKPETPAYGGPSSSYNTPSSSYNQSPYANNTKWSRY